MLDSTHIWQKHLFNSVGIFVSLIMIFVSLPFLILLSVPSSLPLFPTHCKRKMAVQRLWAALHQLHQWEVAAVLQPSYVRARARGVQERGHRLGVHWFRHGLASLYRADWEGIVIYPESRFEYIDPALWELIDPTDNERARHRTSLNRFLRLHKNHEMLMLLSG